MYHVCLIRFAKILIFMTIKQIITTSIILLTIGFIVSCEEDDTQIPVAEDWINVDTNVYFIDSMTVKSSTFKFDSIAVSSTSRLLAGAYTDDIFGTTKSEIYAQITNSDYDIDNEAVYDSISLILHYDDYFYNDTTQVQNFNVYKVIEDIESEDGSYYNTSKFTVNETKIGYKNFTPYPKKEDSLHITLDNTFGKELFEKLQDNEISNIDEFLNEYKGVLITPSENNTTVLGFSNTSVIRLYYSIEEETENEELTTDITFVSTNTFHNISNDYENTVFEDLDNQETQISSLDLDNESYIQSGTGITTRIDIPFIERINDIPGNGSILDANLKLSIKQNSSTDNLFIRDSLPIYMINDKGDYYAALTNSEGETNYGILEDTDNEFKTLTYSIPVNYFLYLKLYETYRDNLYLSINGQDFNQSLDRYILNGENASSNDLKLKLELTYATYED